MSEKPTDLGLVILVSIAGMVFFIGLSWGVIGNSRDPERAKQELLYRGFRAVVVQPASRVDDPGVGDRTQCPIASVSTCTEFQAVSPWGWPVTGVVACPGTGTCRVLVVF